eukprot:7348391-Heterocapsa_arctica.AAC.1
MRSATRRWTDGGGPVRLVCCGQHEPQSENTVSASRAAGLACSKVPGSRCSPPQARAKSQQYHCGARSEMEALKVDVMDARAVQLENDLEDIKVEIEAGRGHSARHDWRRRKNATR